MTSSGTLTMMVGLAFSLRLSEEIAPFVLTCAALGTLLGELVGPLAMLRALDRAGEIAPVSDKTSDAGASDTVGVAS